MLVFPHYFDRLIDMQLLSLTEWFLAQTPAFWGKNTLVEYVISGISVIRITKDVEFAKNELAL